MKKHAFSFPESARNALKQHIRSSIAKISPSRHYHEPSYVSALASQLEGIIYNKDDCYIEIRTTDIDHNRPNSAEKWSGADLVITAIISNSDYSIEKAILIQAKRGEIDKFNTSKKKDLVDKIQKMKQFTKSPKVMQIIDIDSNTRQIAMISGNKILSNSIYKQFALDDYFVRRILTTLDGDTRKNFVDAVQEHSLCKLQIIAKTPRVSKTRK